MVTKRPRAFFYRRFGQKHFIAHGHIEQIVNGPQLKCMDVVGLSHLSAAKPPSIPPPPNGDLNQVGRTYSRSELKPTAEPWYPAPSRFAASGEDHIVSKRLQQVLEQQQEALHVMAYSLQQALQMPKKEKKAKEAIKNRFLIFPPEHGYKKTQGIFLP